ncbi:serpin family protein [Coleofasciculus sp. FACHB-1120]|uniref:serpin family protein n=1 Tax=Coleofasciculus sp. FACHB-1120 TaxID=2692783 RepID=UPI0016871333|nr:serpin family protein [Coleofasciculus sp. FACHB-1120]MBD2742138.1 serpin family protein [Coleofasciculus sp. FACHB-1120]
MKRPTFSLMVAIASISFLLLGFLGCSMVKNPQAAIGETRQPETSPTISQRQKKTVDSRLVAANTKFGFKLFKEILKEDSGKNIFVSPSSVAIALSMTYNGASGDTQQAMTKTLELQGLSLQEVNQANDALKTLLENPDPQVQLTIANSLWAKKGVSFNPEFLQKNRQFYQAKIAGLDFTNPSAPSDINNWVKQNTGGKIKSIINEIPSDQVLFLINALYFKGTWTKKFDQKQTTTEPFYLADGTQKQHPMMSQRDKYKYYENDQFQAVSLPYGKGKLSLYIFLPKENFKLTNFYQQLNTENWEQWMTQFKKKPGFIQMPRFKMDYDIELNDALTALGMEVAFDSKANFTQMSSIPLQLNQVKHKTFVEVNEAGTEAAAVTAVGVVTTSAPMAEEPFEMIVNRPFFACIRDNQTGTVLFMGSIVEPK